MKLAFLAQPFDRVPPRGGGSIGIWLDEVSRRLAGRHEVVVYSPLAPGLPESEEIAGVRHRRVSTELDERVVSAIRRAESLLRRTLGSEVDLFYRYYYFRLVYYLDYVRRVARLVGRQQPDFLVLANFSQFVPALRRANPDVRLALTMHCDWLIQLDARRVERRLRKVDLVTGCSRYISEGIAARFPAHASKCRTLYNGTDLEHFGGGAQTALQARELRRRLGLGDALVILFTGRVCAEKGVHVLLESMRSVAKRVPEAVLVVVGGISRQPPTPRGAARAAAGAEIPAALRGDYAGRLEQLAAPLGGRVRLVGSVPHRELPPYYAMADLFVHPALWNEPFGMILTEAMAGGCPVVSTKAGGIPEVVEEGESGILAEPGDPVSLARALVELARDPERRERMGQRARERAATFTWERTAGQLEAALQASEGRAQRAEGERSSDGQASEGRAQRAEGERRTGSDDTSV